MTSETPPAVLIVEDERELADLYAEYLRESYDFDVAYSGEEALEMIPGGYDVALLDRRMPVVSGNEVVAHMADRGVNCRVALITAVNPDFEIIDMRIDDYLVKPVTRAELRETVDRLLRIDEYNERAQELTSKKLKRNVLEIEKRAAELDDSEEFASLCREIDALETEVDDIAEQLAPDDLERYG